MNVDYSQNYQYRRDLENPTETFAVGAKVVLWTLTGGVPEFVRATVLQVLTNRDPIKFVCQGWDDGRDYEPSVDEIFEMTPQAASYRCLVIISRYCYIVGSYSLDDFYIQLLWG